MLAIRTILHPTDFSQTSKYAFRLACSLARDHGARLVVLHVAPPPQMVSYEGIPLEPSMSGSYQDELQDKLRQIRAPDPGVSIETRLEEGFAAPEIVRVAQETPCDLIVMGTHGRTGLGRLLMGSVAEQVLRKALCPVLTVKAPLRQHGDGDRQASVATTHR
jgi:nucleotide-binding universal stress UspA family protein